MKIAILGDAHFGARGDNQAFHDYFYKFYDDIFFPYLKKNNINTVIQTGDLMDRRKFVNYVTLSNMKDKFINRFKDNNLSLYIILGNHDIYYRNSSEVNSLTELFGHFKDSGKYNINVIDKPTTIEFDKDFYIDLVPWINKDNFIESIKFIHRSSSPICIGHFELKGFTMHKGMKDNDSGMGTKIFTHYDNVFSGHFHTRSNNKNIKYVGSPYELTWSDYNDNKGFHIFDTKTGNIDFIENPYKMHHKIFYDDSIEDFTKHDVLKYSNSLVKLIIVNKTKPEMFEFFIEKLYNVKILDLGIIDNSLSYSDDDLEEVETEDTLTVLFNSIDNLTGDDRLDKSKMKNIMQELYNESLELSNEK